MATPAISFAEVAKDFPFSTGQLSVRALDRFSLTLSSGEVVASLGSNGSGKSTAIKLALGLIKQTQGKVLMQGGSAESSEVRLKAGFVPDVGGIPLHMSGREALVWWAKMNDLALGSTADRVREVLADVDLVGVADRRISEYSRGMKKRLALA
mgnify:CR=1 FL=1